MTAASSGTPLILSLLALVLALVSTVGSIAAMLMARANVRWQTAVAARETWKREFREQVAALLASQDALAQHSENIGPEVPQGDAEIKHARRSAYHRIRLLFAEGRTLEDEAFIHILDRFMRDEDALGRFRRVRSDFVHARRVIGFRSMEHARDESRPFWRGRARAPVAAIVAVRGLVSRPPPLPGLTITSDGGPALRSAESPSGTRLLEGKMSGCRIARASGCSSKPNCCPMEEIWGCPTFFLFSRPLPLN